MTFQDIANRVSFLTGTTVTDYTAANLTLAVNRALERVVSLINKSDSNWQYDDSNQSDLPIATTTITSGQQDYSLATTHLSIDRIEVKDSSGQWTRLSPIDQQTLKRDRNVALAEYQPSNGVPTEYDVVGSSIFLYPTPNYTQAASIKVYFTRGPLLFTYTSYSAGTFTDSTGSISSSPGFNSLFHDLLAQWAAYDWEINKKKDGSRLASILQMEQELKSFYGGRNRDARPRLSVSTDSNK